MWKKPYAPPLLWAAVILTGSSVSIPPGPEQDDWTNLFGNIDKLGHFSEYLIFALLLGIGFLKMNKNLKTSMVRVLGIICFFALFDEYHQRFIPGRSCDLFDYATDMFAGFFACIILWKKRASSNVA